MNNKWVLILVGMIATFLIAAEIIFVTTAGHIVSIKRVLIKRESEYKDIYNISAADIVHNKWDFMEEDNSYATAFFLRGNIYTVRVNIENESVIVNIHDL